MRTTLGADRSREHLEAHAVGETVTNSHLRAEHVVEWATRGGAKALGLDNAVGSLEAGKKADVVLIKNDSSPAMFPLLNPYGHVALQAQRGDVHTVVVNGRVVKHEHQLVGIDLAAARGSVTETIEHLQSALGAEAWAAGMNPDIPETKILDNPYQYTEFRTATTHAGGPEE
jgi:5-methylthioadenosine/S-adenosylhomocysteine deaminase